ncbi:AbrB/MazE/SpoVT family DNA-binding domain-containing protein [Bacillus cereus group sp. TH36-2LC]|uniref:AbrB/MazE/SpoVT family DNA-binding domain-containing protein n=1 Tax=Bacillus cereus group sp. TH36-2LC TaxID=3018040 RepID=UPI0022E5FCC1|nr:AbrB/MazE/SpoVT family DNA-binding domain-containing protein [Bacillus cereus group sp. TH36-2LC]MDA1509592.1 AbrB/MazE/SpoVT family DNA-binding domain-containing protein [Bacillus cereus group sp. TH36-2LC]
MKRKLRKIGNSLGVILPKDMIDNMELNEGDTVEIIYNSVKKQIIIKDEKNTPNSDESELREIVIRVLKEMGLD